MNGITIDIKNLLAANGYSASVGDWADSPDEAIVINDYPGRAPELNYEWDTPAFQILVRGAMGDYVTTSARAQAIATLLHGYQGTINGARYALISQIASVSGLGKDEKGRPIFSGRFDVQRTTA